MASSFAEHKCKIFHGSAHFGSKRCTSIATELSLVWIKIHLQRYVIQAVQVIFVSINKQSKPQVYVVSVCDYIQRGYWSIDNEW